MSLRLALPAILTLLAAAAPPLAAQERPAEQKRPSVIFFIGDGMGMSQLTLGRLGAQAQGRAYHFDRFQVVGLSSTRSVDRAVTDSAAGATALACGVKTKNWRIAVDAEGKPLPTLLERVHELGYATGLVTTTRITHATPACFATHVQNRNLEDAIAEQLATKGYPELLIGGGARFFPARRQAALKERGYELVLEKAGLAGAKGPKLAALLAPSHLPYVVDQGSVLPALTQKAVELLAPRGAFFLMVEGGKVDHAAHQHDAASCIKEQLDLDAAIGWALDWARERPDVLVVVTADHATGNLGISEKVDVPGLLRVAASSDAVVARAKGDDPAQRAALEERFAKAYGSPLTPAEVEQVFAAPRDPYWAATMVGNLASRRFGVEFYDVPRQQALHKETHGHDGAMVPVFAMGRGAAAFAGVYENTQVAVRLARLLGVQLDPRADAARAPAGGLRHF